MRIDHDIDLLIYKPVKLAAVARSFYEERIAPDPLSARIAAVTLCLIKNNNVNPGKYKIVAGSNLLRCVLSLSEQKPNKLRITFPEGFTNAQIVRRINNTPTLTGKIKRLPMEGVLFPSTYSYIPGDDRQSIIDKMQAFMEKVLNSLSKHKPFDKKRILTIASIIEKETGYQEERRLVASVYINRLKKMMRLQSCPTVIYSMTYGQKRFPFKLKKVHLFNVSAYNTYRLKGLPPTPICNPSRESIEAAINPANVDFLFFISDGNSPLNKHRFSKDFQDHVKNREYLNK